MTVTALSDAQLWTVVTGAGWTGQDALTAFCIALAESGGDPTKTNTKNTNGSTDYGLFQINSVHTALLNGKNWQDPTVNAAMAFSLYKGRGNKFIDWATYNNPVLYTRFMGRAQAASASGGAPVPASDSSGSAPDPSTPEGQIAVATSANTWQRIGMFLGGGLLLLIVTISLIKNTSIGKAVTNVAKTATKVAAV